jgi:TonB-linked SusC/RagA family outer membrane protein
MEKFREPKASEFFPEREGFALKKIFRMLRFTLFCFFLGLIQVMALDSYSQQTRLTLNEHGRRLEDVLKTIEDKTEFFFLYNRDLINVDQKIDISVTNQTIKETLDALLKGTDIHYSVTNRQIILSNLDNGSGLPAQQQKTVSGAVTDASGVSLPGVSVVVKGTTTGTITDADGKFSLTKIPENAILQFSFVGMKTQEVNVTGKANVSVALVEDAIGIEEVVAVGYGTMKKSDLTGSITTANIERFRESPNTNVLQSLSGTVAGLDVGQVTSSGSNPSLMIRGKNSISGSTSPLIVVDGIIYGGSLSSINSADVERIDILKDASSAAVYGAEAANGVVLITTKQAKSKTGKPMFNYSTSYSISSPTNTPTPLNRQQFYDKAKGVYWSLGGYLAPDYTTPNPDFDPTSVWQRSPLKEGWKNGTDFNWLDAVTQVGHIQDHLFSISNSNETSKYYISAGYTDQLGYIMNDKYKRWTSRINIENKLTKWMDLGIRSYVATEDYSGAEPSLASAIRFSPLVTPYDASGNLVTYPDGQLVENPFYSSDIDDVDKRLELNGTVFLNINIPHVKGLSYRATMNNRYNTRRRFYFNQWANTKNGAAQKYNSSEYDWTLDQIINYKRTFNEVHNFDITLVAGREERDFEDTDAKAAYFSNKALGYNSLESGTAANSSLASGAWNESSLYAMGRFNYNYKSKYLATFTVRRDGFSGFAENNKWGTFPSAALAWVMSEENFVKQALPFVEYLKLRGSYGENGNKTNRYSSLATVASSYQYVFGNGSSPYMGESVTALSNKDLGWEKTIGLDFGLDFTVKFLTANIDYYNSNTTNLFWNISLPNITGFSSIASNVGKLNNSGIELTLTSTNIKIPDFSWQTTVNFTRNRNKMVNTIDINGDGDTRDDLISQNLFIGKSIDAIYDYTIERIYQLTDQIPKGFYPGTYKLKDLNDDGSITPLYDRSIIGYKDPSYQLSISNTFTYKKFTLMVYVNSVQGGKNRYLGTNDPITYIYGRDNVLNDNTFAEWDFWTPANPNATYARIDGTTSSISPNIMQQRSFVRLQDVSLSYQFDSHQLKKLGLGSAKLYISGKNLYTWTKWKGWDPETGQGLISNGRPVMKDLSLGLDISF